MPLPLDRATKITKNATALSMEYLNELINGVSDERKKAIERDMALINIIVKTIAWPYRNEIGRYSEDGEDLLKDLGLN